MSGRTKIEWATHQWNPITGCSKVSQGCKHCYAEREWPRLAAPRAKPNIYTGRAFTDVKCHPEKLDIPLHWAKPRRIFVNSMSDLFHEHVPNSFIADVFQTMEFARHHIFMILTKRPDRMQKFMTVVNNGIREVGYPQGVTGRFPNVWLGVSVEDQATADERIPLLLQTPAAVRWISAEPLLAPLDIRPFLFRNRDPKFRVCPQCLYSTNRADFVCPNDGTALQRNDIALDWIVVGGESGPQARPMHPDWVRSIRDQCQVAGMPFFFKQWGEFAPNWLNDDNGNKIAGTEWIDRMGKKMAGRKLDGRTWDEYPNDAKNN